MRRTAATLVVTAGLLAGSVGQAAAVGSWAEEPVPAPDGAGKLTDADSARGESWAFAWQVVDLAESGKVTELIQVGDQVQLFGIGPNLEPF
ncbi:hypothetical protein [Saccharopolyspora gloriosae]|uniref:hypothetical protein n=1 Tax=Saccharopolyspora gloriosae TaxID=455344 RepID=UPI001FB6D7DA|nr:hypothetical protein [Saccharopolyspora gloriosae]